jgi:hypothetical protein
LLLSGSAISLETNRERLRLLDVARPALFILAGLSAAALPGGPALAATPSPDPSPAAVKKQSTPKRKAPVAPPTSSKSGGSSLTILWVVLGGILALALLAGLFPLLRRRTGKWRRERTYRTEDAAAASANGSDGSKPFISS